MAEDLGSIGDLGVGFKVDMAGLDSGVNSAKTKLESVGNSAKSSAEKASEGMSGMLKNALSFAAGQAIFTGVGDAIGFVKDQLGGVYDETTQAQMGMAQTTAVLKSTHDASGMTAQGIADLAGNLSHLTEFSDDTTQAAENMLLTFTNIGKSVFPQATKTVLDMSQALGQDTKSSAIQLGKALNDPITGITALQRVGVTFTQGQKDSIKAMMDHGQVAKAQAVILKELGREFGGTAEAAGKTLPGQLKILGQNFDDIKQKVGDALMPVVNTLVGTFEQDAMPVFEKVSDWFDKVGAPAIDKFTGKGGALQPILSGISGAFSDISSVAGPLGQDVEGFVQALSDGGDKGGPFKAILQDIHDVMPGVDKFVLEVGGDINQYLVPPIKDLVGKLADWAGKGGGVNTILQTLGDVAQPTAKAIGTLVGWVADLVGWLDGSGVGNMTLKVALYGVIGLFAVDKVKQFGSAVQGTVGNIRSTIDQIGGIKDKLGEALNFAKDTFMKGWNAVFGKGGETSKSIGETNASVESIGTEVSKTEKKVAVESGKIGDDLSTGVETGSGAGGVVAADAEIKTIATTTGETEATVATESAGMGNDLSTNIEKGVIKADAEIGSIATTTGETEATVNAETAGMGAGFSGLGGLIALLPLNIMGFQNAMDNAWNDFQSQNWSAYFGNLFTPGNVGGAAGTDISLWQHLGLPGLGPNIGPTTPQGHRPGGRGFASGGDVDPGWFVAGERGPELIHAGGAGHVYDAGQTRGMLQSAFNNGASLSGPPVIHVHNHNTVHNYIDGREMADVTGQHMLKTMHSFGPVGKAA